ncbi:MAG: hypothetical protein H0T76_09920 [Nannocystis sp.]|nr:hypothetical protein [Nannocystis sp.]MBA3546787.1 hypothetical protein [Nannocystis sp.]
MLHPSVIMTSTLDKSSQRAGLIVGLVLYVAACAHGPVTPSAPRIPIAVAPIGFGPENGLTPEEQAECELGKQLAEELHDEVGQSFAFSGIVDPRGVPGLVLNMRFARVEGISGRGSKRIVLEGQLVKDGQVVAHFTSMRGAFGNYSRGFTTTCSIMEDVVEELAEDVGEWLYRPTMNAKLGDLSGQ